MVQTDKVKYDSNEKCSFHHTPLAGGNNLQEEVPPSGQDNSPAENIYVKQLSPF